jgi:sialate O-acetylesterase
MAARAARAAVLAAAVATACAAPAPAPAFRATSYTYFQGFLAAGDDLFNATLTVADAEAQCTASPLCAGFTFVNTTAGPVYDVFFKTALAPTASPQWSAYFKVLPHVLSATFSSHAVLQADTPCLWGYGGAVGDAVNVTSTSDGVLRTGVVASNLTWRVCLLPQAPGGPWNVTVSVAGAGTVQLSDILMGEVWLASGQSNMAFATQQAFNSSAECAAAAAWPLLRVMTVAQLTSNVSLADFGPGGVRQPWAVASPASICGGGDFDYFTAVGFFFARALLAARPGVPVGVIASTVPGTSIELWSSAEAMAECNATEGAGERARVLLPPRERGRASLPGWEGAAAAALGADSDLYNAMISPLLGVPIAGAIYWQGESNVGMASYACRFPALITDWRRKWAAAAAPSFQPAFPFLFVQLSPYYVNTPACLDGGNGVADPGDLPAMRVTQVASTAALPNMGMASAVDIGDAASPFWPGSVHPRWKQRVAERLALEARRVVYGETGLLSRGPQLTGVAVMADDGDHAGSYHGKDSTTLRLTFNSTGSGLRLTSQAQVAFVATYNDSSRVPGTVLPTNLTASSVDLYLTPYFGADQLFPTSLDALWFDFPVVPIFGSTGLPMEPFRVPLNASALAAARGAGGGGVERDAQGLPWLWRA